MATFGEPAARLQLMNRAAMVGLLMRCTVNLGVSLIALADPNSLALPSGRWLLGTLAAWSLYRLLTRSQGTGWLAIDYAAALVVCLAIPVLAPATDFYASNSAPQAIAGTAVISISVSVSMLAAVPMAVGIAIAYAVGAATVFGWENLTSVTALYYFAVQCATASIIRLMLLHVAGAIDRARRDRAEAEVAERVTDAVRDYEHEQLALLHDTAASTLLMVGQGTDLPPGAWPRRLVATFTFSTQAAGRRRHHAWNWLPHCVTAPPISQHRSCSRAATSCGYPARPHIR